LLAEGEISMAAGFSVGVIFLTLTVFLFATIIKSSDGAFIVAGREVSLLRHVFAKMPRRHSYLLGGVSVAMVGALGLWITSGASVAGSVWAAVVSDSLSRPLAYGIFLIVVIVALGLLGRRMGKNSDALAILSNSDPLTSLCNRRHLEQRLAEEVTRHQRYGG
jgi:hypothetical protein